MKKTTKSLIIAISSVAVLVGGFLAVYYLLPSQENADDDTVSNPVSRSTSESEEDHYHLISYAPADIKKIDVENETGKYTVLSSTPTVESENSSGTLEKLTADTVYTLVGYEDMELNTGSPDTLADDASSVTATKIVNDGSKKSDFGFDSPRAVINVEYTSGDKKTIRVGDDAPSNKGAYLMIDGDENVYLVESDSVDGFLGGAMEMLSKEIGKTADQDEDNIFTQMKFSGDIFDGKEVEFGYPESGGFTETYVIKSPDKSVANEETVSYMLGSVRSLTAKSVIQVNADEASINKYGLDKPYVTVKAQYPDIKVNYKATKPDSEGNFYLLSNNIIYQMNKESVPWVNYKYEQLFPTEVLSPDSDKVTKITVEANGKKYDFVVSRTTETTHDDDKDTDVESTSVAVTCNGKEISEGCYNSFYQNLTSAKRNGLSKVNSDKKKLLTVTYEFTDGTNAKAEYFEGENRKCSVLVNDTLGSMSYDSYVKKIIEDVSKAANGETVTSIY